jgi:uncharacterized phage infection (PIP) family protein YhgE
MFDKTLDNLLEELNMLPKCLINNQFIAFCSMVSNMAHEIVDLKKEIAKELDANAQKIEELKNMAKNASAEGCDK